MLEIVDYFIIGYLVILFLITAYFRRSNESKLKSYLSYSFLFTACLSTLGFFTLFYLIDNYQKFYIIYIVLSVAILISFSLISYFKDKNERLIEIEDEKNKNEE